jgi:hypothetical protein
MFKSYSFRNILIKKGIFFIINYLNYNMLINFLFINLNFNIGVCKLINN